MTDTSGSSDTDRDGTVLDAGRLADVMAIQDLASAYAHAVDDRDWRRWEALFVPDAYVDYTSAGGIAGSPAALAAWLPGAMAAFAFCLHSTSTHEIRFTGVDRAAGRVHVFNRNGVRWEGRNEIFDVGAVYEDEYVRIAGAWKFARRVERTKYLTGGAFAEMIRRAASANPANDPPPFG